MNTPVQHLFTKIQISQITEMFQQGKTRAEIGEVFGKPPRTIGKLLNHLGLKRTHAEAARIKISSPLDTPEIIQQISVMRSDHTLKEIARQLGSSVAAVQRICIRHGIALPADYAKKQSHRMKNAWTADKRRLASNSSKARCTIEVKEKIREQSKRIWKDLNYKRVQAEQRSRQSFAISSIQKHLYEMLDDLKIAYYREYDDKPNDPETVIGPYNFDCVIPRPGLPTLLIECHGDYWHSSEKTVRKDEQKQSYITNNFKGQYELKTIWEHEFKCKDKVHELLKYWLGITEYELATFSFADLSIRQIQVKEANTLLDKYHYLSGCGRGGIIYGAYQSDSLVAVCSFSTLIRQNLPYDHKTSRELSRFCIHPKYQKKNFGSWFISKCIRLLPSEIDLIVSYCDTTFNHDGALYRASNFTRDGEVRPDYWYVSDKKWVMHKKTLYQHAKKMSMTEVDFAEKNGYIKVYGSTKIRYLFRR